MTSAPKILLVDDSRLSRLVCRQILESLRPGWTFDEVGTGEAAVDFCKNAVPHLILMDVNMPGIGGLEACARIRSEHPNVPLSLLTANVQEAVRSKAKLLDVHFCDKPITLEKIETLLAKMGL